MPHGAFTFSRNRSSRLGRLKTSFTGPEEINLFIFFACLQLCRVFAFAKCSGRACSSLRGSKLALSSMTVSWYSPHVHRRSGVRRKGRRNSPRRSSTGVSTSSCSTRPPLADRLARVGSSQDLSLTSAFQQCWLKHRGFSKRVRNAAGAPLPFELVVNVRI